MPRLLFLERERENKQWQSSGGGINELVKVYTMVVGQIILNPFPKFLLHDQHHTRTTTRRAGLTFVIHNDA